MNDYRQRSLVSLLFPEQPPPPFQACSLLPCLVKENLLGRIRDCGVDLAQKKKNRRSLFLDVRFFFFVSCREEYVSVTISGVYQKTGWFDMT